MHHIASDGWSMSVMTRELAELYAAFSQGQASPLPEPELQYADYALWQRDWLQGEALQRQLDYWRDRLADAPAVLDLPTDRPRPATPSYRGATAAFHLPPALHARLDALAKAEGATAEELSETVMIASALRAGGSFAHGFMAMKFFEGAPDTVTAGHTQATAGVS